MSLEKTKQQLLKSFVSDGGINHLDGPNLPSQEAIDALARDMIHLMFPGFFRHNEFPRERLEDLLEQRLSQLHGKLTREIRKCLVAEADISARRDAETEAEGILAAFPPIRRLLQTDVEAAYLGDPAARSYEEIILAYPCIFAISLQRIAHVAYERDIPLLPRMLTEYAHRQTGIDIHPGARIGSHFFIDHGTGVVIGETTTIGSHVKLYQGVTLGAKSFKVDPEGKIVKGIKRHPDIEDRVTIYSGATILGGETRIGADSIVGANVWLMESIPAHSIAYYKGENLVVRSRKSREKAEG